jgi:hypothetical protein
MRAPPMRLGHGSGCLGDELRKWLIAPFRKAFEADVVIEDERRVETSVAVAGVPD